MTAREQLEASAIEQAGEWYARHRDGKLTREETQAFMAWLQASPIHVREYLAAAELSAHLPAAAEGLAIDRDDLIARARAAVNAPGNIVSLRPAAPAPAVHRARSARRPKWFAAIAAVLVLALTGGMYWQLGMPGLMGGGQSLEIPRGEQRTVQLDDGSVLHMNAETHVRIRYTARQRLIKLDHGQAMFNVAKDATRPFVVRAGSTDVVAVGTQFDVLKRDGKGPLTVTVVEGKVDVREGGDAAAKRVRVAAGQRLRVNKLLVVAEPEAVDVHTATAWLRRELMFTEQPLAEVAEEFSRYGTPIAIDTPALREYRVSGVFNAYDTESFVTFLKRIGEVEQTPDGIRVR